MPRSRIVQSRRVARPLPRILRRQLESRVGAPVASGAAAARRHFNAGGFDMAHIRPFRVYRPRPDLASQVAELPYDVLNSEEARVLVEGNPHSFMRVDRGEVELPSDTDAHAPEVYAKAREVLDRLISMGSLEDAGCEAFYAYRLRMGDHTQIGLVAGVSVDDYEKGSVKRHEFTRADKELDRVTHIEACDAHTGPILLTFRGSEDISSLMTAATAGLPLYDFVAADGVAHTVWSIEGAELIAAFTEAIYAAGPLYIADGHHRCVAAAIVAKKMRAAKPPKSSGALDAPDASDPSQAGEEGYNWFLAVSFPEAELRVMDYNRLVADLNGLSASEYLSRVATSFEVTEATSTPYKPTERHTFGMLLDGKWYRLAPRTGSFDEADPIGRLDVSILQENLLRPILGIDDARTNKRIDFVGGIRGLGELERRAADGMRVAFSLYPVSVREMMDVADSGTVMPPKSTWFEPKLRSGLFVHPLSYRRTKP